MLACYTCAWFSVPKVGLTKGNGMRMVCVNGTSLLSRRVRTYLFLRCKSRVRTLNGSGQSGREPMVSKRTEWLRMTWKRMSRRLRTPTRKFQHLSVSFVENELENTSVIVLSYGACYLTCLPYSYQPLRRSVMSDADWKQLVGLA